MSYDNLNHAFRRNRFSEPSQLTTVANLWTPTTTQKHMLGCIFDTNDGRRFRYAKNRSAAILAKALMNQQAAADTDHQNIVQTLGTASVIGDKSIVISVTTAPAAHDWDNGWLVVQDGTGQNEAYLVKSHTLTTTPRIQIADTGGIRTATATTSDITMVKNLWRNVVVHPVTTATGLAVGVSQVAVPASSFCWLQTIGPCPMLVDNGDSLVIGEPCGLPGTGNADGEVGVPINSSTTLKDGNVWGKVMDIGAADETALVYLTLE